MINELIKSRTWEEFKAIVFKKNLKLNYNEQDAFYEIFAKDTMTWYFTILKDGSMSTELADFEENYKPDANKKTIYFNAITDKENPDNVAVVDDNGRLLVYIPTPTPPAGRTLISSTLQSSVGGTNDSFTTIPNGESIIIQRFKGGAADGNGGSKVELYYAPNGNTTGLVLLEVVYVNSNSLEVNLEYESPVGNGTRAILLRRVGIGGGNREIFGKWEGYY